jgi:hypothetical protein
MKARQTVVQFAQTRISLEELDLFTQKVQVRRQGSMTGGLNIAPLATTGQAMALAKQTSGDLGCSRL